MEKAPSTPLNGALSPGYRLGPYTIVELLGAGGMGEVYRAQDPRLGREVALKILRGSHSDAEHVARFSREARAAGSLNHPNIVAVYDVDTQAGVPYVVSELLVGETLRARLNRSQLPYRKAVEYGIQIAQALDAAHVKGIWHRDVKPANAFITEDGRVKLLDFGIAKLTERQLAGPHDSTLDSTREGEVRGTAGYMSPEQVLGEAVDHRSDIFALGAVLYEMFTGARAFQRPSTVETMNAVLQEDPTDPLTLNDKLPLAAAAVVRRCLEKNKEERFQSARDLSFDLQQLRDLTGTTKTLGAAPVSLRRRVLPAIVIAATLLGGLALGLIMSRSPAAATFDQLTFQRGRIGGARFASEGGAVIYSEARVGNESEVWRIDLADSPASRLLEYPKGTDILAARAGELALSMRRRFVLGERFVGTLALAPLGGGAPREAAENVEDADWDPSGTQLAIVRSTGSIGGPTWIEYPIGTTLYKTATGSIRFLRVSRDGQRIAFLEDSVGRGVGGRVTVIDLKGQATPLTSDWQSVRGLAWSTRGDEIWFTAGELRTKRALRAVNLEKEERLILEMPGSLTLWDLAPDGRALLTRDEERKTVVGVPPGETAERDLSWFDNSGVASISADGRWILLGDRVGVYVRGMDGSPPVNLGLKDGFADDLSPDGEFVLATANSSRQLLILPRKAGDARPLPAHGIIRYLGSMWFPDGRRILVNGNEADRGLRSYVQEISGGSLRAITPEGTWGLSISPDGEWVAATGTGQPISLWPVAGGASKPIPGSQPDERAVAWHADGRSLWTYRRGEVPVNVFRVDIASGRRQLWKKLLPPDAAGVYSVIEFEITPAGHAYCYSYSRLLSQLYLTRGLK